MYLTKKYDVIFVNMMS